MYEWKLEGKTCDIMFNRKYSYGKITHVPCLEDDKRETRAAISTLQCLSMPWNGAAARGKGKGKKEVSSITVLTN